MLLRIVLASALIAAAPHAHAQFDLLTSPTTSSLRGVSSPGAGIAWISGADGAIFRSEDGGYLWQHCAVPTGGEHLDFRGIQAFDANTALVLSSGKGPLSKVFKTTDGCTTWTLVLDDPDPDGFFDDILFVDRQHGLVFGDPAHGSPATNPIEGGYFAFRFRLTGDGGATWAPVTDPERPQPGRNLMPLAGEGGFAASNQAVAMQDGWLWFGTSGGRVLRRRLYQNAGGLSFGFTSNFCAGVMDRNGHCGVPWTDLESATLPMASGAAAGVFALSFRDASTGVAVGGDYTKPADPTGTAAFTSDGGLHWTAASIPPHGYRSSVAYDARHKAWLAVGTSGADVSFDDGRTWRPVAGPNAAGWNAIALPFLVGAHGRIALVPETVFQR